MKKKNNGYQLLFSATLNKHIKVIKYVVEELGENIIFKNNDNDCLSIACKYNMNSRVIGYIMNKLGINDLTNINYLNMAIQHDNVYTITYLIEETNIDISKANIENIPKNSKEFLLGHGYMYFINQNKYVNLIRNILSNELFDQKNIEILIDYILENNLKGNILNYEKLFENIEYYDIINLFRNDIKFNFKKKEPENIKNKKIRKHSKKSISFKINNIEYKINEHKLRR